MKAKDLKPDKRNPRKITQDKLDMLKKSLIKFGDMSGIVFNKRTGVLISGHQRMKVLPEDAEIIIERTFTEPTESGTTSEGYVKLGTENMKYREVDVDLDTQLAMNIAANKHSGDWDIPVLNEILLDLDAANYDLSLTGFNENELENLLAPANEIDLPELSSEDPLCQQVTFILSNEQKDILDEAMELAVKKEDCTDEINQNKNGNILATILRHYVGC